LQKITSDSVVIRQMVRSSVQRHHR